MCQVCGPQYKELKVVASFSLGDVQINNALAFSSGILQFGGPLVKNTDVTGAFILNLGTSASRLLQANISASAQVLLEYNNGSQAVSIKADPTGFLITDTTPNPKGLHGAADFKANYSSNSYVQKSYVDTTIASKSLSALLLNPGVGQTGYAITWDNTAGNFTLSPGSSFTAGTNTQIIFNDGGVLAGNANFLFNKTGNGQFTVNYMVLGSPTYTGGEVLINSGGTQTNVDIRISPKNNGNVILGIQSGGSVLIGEQAGSFNIVKIKSRGNDSLIHFGIEPKGTEGRVYIGNSTEAGGNRYLDVTGTATNINLVLAAKGSGEIIIGSNLTSNVKTLKAGSSLSTCALIVASKGGGYINIDTSGNYIFGGVSTSRLQLGSSADTASGVTRLITVDGAATNINLFLYGKGTGKVFINESTFLDIDIGNWDCETNTNIVKAHNLDWTKIIAVTVSMRNDDNTERFNLISHPTQSDLNTGYISWDATNIKLGVRVGGPYDVGGNFNGTGFSRGTIRVWYNFL